MIFIYNEMENLLFTYLFIFIFQEDCGSWAASELDHTWELF